MITEQFSVDARTSAGGREQFPNALQCMVGTPAARGHRALWDFVPDFVPHLIAQFPHPASAALAPELESPAGSSEANVGQNRSSGVRQPTTRGQSASAKNLPCNRASPSKDMVSVVG